MFSSAAKLRFADFVAARLVQHASMERALVVACRNRFLRRGLHAGALAVAYARVLERPEIRMADLGEYKLFVNVAEHLGIAPYFFGDSGTAWLTADLLTHGSIYVDAGANVGHYTCFIASRNGPDGKVFAFEPNPVYAELISRSIETNGFGGMVKVDRRALWERTGETLTFYLSTAASNSGLSSLILHGDHLSAERTMTVETVTLSDYAHQESIDHFRLVKIDVERAEHHVLRGMTDLLRDGRIDYLIVEMLAHGEAHGLLTEHGYACFLLDPSRRRLIDARRITPRHFGDYLLVSQAMLLEFGRKFSRALG
jgi:FkbM family methyltransferase